MWTRYDHYVFVLLGCYTAFTSSYLVPNCHSTLRNIPEEQRPHLFHSKRLKSPRIWSFWNALLQIWMYYKESCIQTEMYGTGRLKLNACCSTYCIVTHCEQSPIILYMLLFLITVNATVFHCETALLFTRIPDRITALHSIHFCHQANALQTNHAKTEPLRTDCSPLQC